METGMGHDNCIKPYNAMCERVEPYTRLLNPWEYLGLVARGICDHIEQGIANDAELEICELVNFLEVLQGDWESAGAQEQQHAIPDLFREYAQQHGAASVIDKYASNYSKLFGELSKEKYEQFWRVIYRVLEETQDGIPSYSESCREDNEVEVFRRFITKSLHEQGFAGEYPRFYSCEPIKGPCLFFSYGNTHIAFNEKNAVSFILCREQCDEGVFGMDFFCGIKFKPKRSDDVFSCMFDCAGKSFFSCFTAWWRGDNADEEFGEGISGDWMAIVDKVLSAAVKSSRLKHLNTGEYAYKHTAPVWNSIGFYIVYFIVNLVLFGAIMSLGFMAIEVLLVFLFTQSPAGVAECFYATPWKWIFTASGLSYAGIMTACTYRSMRK